MRIIALRPVWFALSGILIGSSILAVALFGLKQGIDFTGGSMLALRFGSRPAPADVQQKLAPLNLGDVTIQPVGEDSLNFRLKTLDEAGHQKIVQTLNAAYGTTTELEFTSIGPSIGQELRQKSLSALVIIFGAILLFIAYSFRRVSTPVQSWKYGAITIVSAFHDVILPLGVFALLGKFAGVEIGTPFIAAILTIMGYSINDTIVVFDRIRENLQKTSGNFEEIVERSVHQTALRSLYTSMTTLLALTAVYFFGGESIKYFALALIIGIATGTYSSIFIASPLLVSWNRWTHARSK